MVKVVSYRQKLIELARIYKIDRVFDQNLKLTTYDIEIILLKNSVPIPSRRGYISHKLINEVFNPFYDALKKKISFNINININFNVNKIYKNSVESLRKKFSFNINISKYIKKFFNGIENYFNFIISNIVNFFKILSKTTIESLNNIYNYKIKEAILRSFFSKTAYGALIVAIVFTGFYIKGIVTDVDSLKISLEIKSDKKTNYKKLTNKEIKKTPEKTKKK